MAKQNSKTDGQQVKVIVLKRFRDKFDHKTWYEEGEEYEFEVSRADDLIERELAEPVESIINPNPGSNPPVIIE